MLKTIIKVLPSLIVTFFLVTCDKYEFPKSPYPRIETLPVVNISETGVTFQANIIQLGESEITNHGFVWGLDENLAIGSEDKVQLGAKPGLGKFEADVKSGLTEGDVYFVRAFAATQDYLVYGEAVSFTSKGSTPPIIRSFSPVEGTWGDTVTIKGRYFSSRAKSNLVKFGTFISKVVVSNDSTIKCIVPNDIAQKTVTLYLAVAGNQTQSTNNFILISPKIENFFPAQATFEDVVTITGSNFSSINGKNIVKFNEHVAEVIQSSNSQLKVKVPTAIRKKESVVSVTVNLQSANANTPFIVAPPSISSISTTKAFIGETIHVSGGNFNPTSSGNLVLLEGLPATILSASKSLISIQLPQGVYKKRSFPLEVIVAEQSAFSQEIFTLQDTWIRKADVPRGQFGRYDAVAFSINGMGYIGLGSGGVGNKFWQYNPAENSWTEVAPFPGGERAGATSFVIGDKAYVGLGGGAPNDFWSFHPTSNSWSRMSDFPYSAYRAVGLSANGKGYVVTSNETENFWEYDYVSDAWTMQIDYPGSFLPHFYPDAGFVLNESLYILSGDNSTGPSPFYEFNFSINSWTEREYVYIDGFGFGATGFAINGFGYIGLGHSLYKYIPMNNTWEHSWGPGLRSYSVVFKIGNKIYFGTGQGGTDFWEFDPDFER